MRTHESHTPQNMLCEQTRASLCARVALRTSLRASCSVQVAQRQLLPELLSASRWSSCSVQVALRKLFCASWSVQVALCKVPSSGCPAQVAPRNLPCTSCSAQVALCKLLCASYSAQVGLYKSLCARCPVQVALRKLLRAICLAQVALRKLLCVSCSVQVTFEGRSLAVFLDPSKSPWGKINCQSVQAIDFEGFASSNKESKTKKKKKKKKKKHFTRLSLRPAAVGVRHYTFQSRGEGVGLFTERGQLKVEDAPRCHRRG